MEQAAAPLVDDRQVRRAFARAAAGYDGAAFVAREVGGRMAERLDRVNAPPKPAGRYDLGDLFNAA